MNSILREQATTRLRADDFLTKLVGGQSQVIVAEFWEISGGPVSTEMTVAQDQARQQQDGDAVTVTSIVGAQEQARQEQDADAVTAAAAAVGQDQAEQQQQGTAATAIASSVEQGQAAQEQDADAEARDPVTSTDVTVAQDQDVQQQSGILEPQVPAAVNYGGGYYYSGPETRRRPEAKKKALPKKIPHGLSWPERWPETIPEILPPLQVTTNCAVDQEQVRQEQRILAKTAQGWQPFNFQPAAFSPEAIRIQPPPAPRKAPAWPAASSPIRRPAAISRVTGRAPDGGSSKRMTEEEELLVIIAADE